MINRKIHKRLFNSELKAHKLYANIKSHKEDMPITPEIKTQGQPNKRYKNYSKINYKLRRY